MVRWNEMTNFAQPSVSSTEEKCLHLDVVLGGGSLQDLAKKERLMVFPSKGKNGNSIAVLPT